MSLLDMVQIQVQDRILIVDDDVATCRMLQMVLEREGYQAEVVCDGPRALAMIREAAHGGCPYALVLVDLHLQEMSGLEVLRQARQAAAETQTVIITGHADVSSAVGALREGAQDYLLKPYHLAELKGIVAKLLEARAEAMRNARLLAAARRRASELAVLNRIGQTVTRSLDLDQVLALILEQIQEALSVEAGSIALLEAGKLVFRAASGPAAEQIRNVTLEPGQGLMGSCALEGQPIIANQVADDGRHFAGVDAQTRFVTRSALCVPLKVAEGRVIGVIEAMNRRDGQGFTQDDLDLLQAISVPAAIAVENARLHSHLAERARELAQALEELQEMDRLKGEFVQSISHELRTPLTFIKGYVELLENEFLGPLTGEQAEGLALVAAQSNTLQQLVDDILLMQECKLDADQMEPTALEDVVRQAVSRAASAPEPREIRVQWPAQRCWVMAQPEYLIKALANLLDNALKFDPAGHPVDVAVGDQGDAWEVRVSDQGIGIPAGELDKVFERFYQVDGSTTRRFGGVGLGLAVAKEIVEAHGGHIWVQSAPGAGSTFGVVLPKASGHT